MQALKSFQNMFKIPELKSRILFTLGLLAVYRIGAHIPTPGIDGSRLAALLNSYATKGAGNMMDMIDMFSGGALSQVTIFALGIMPYISASIILQLLTVVIPALGKLAKEGEQGKKKITKYTRYLTVGISIVQALFISVGLEQMTWNNYPIVPEPGMSFKLIAIITLTAGTAFIMWLGEQITERGIGNGISLIIFAGIVARFPAGVIKTIDLVRNERLSIFMMALIVILMIAVVAFIIFIERGQRKLPVHYAKRVVGRRVYGGQQTHLPLKINVSGVIPPIFASSIVLFPATLGSFIQVPWVQNFSQMLSPGRPLYIVLYSTMIFFFAYFYTAVVFNPVDVADNLKKYGGFIPGIRPGKNTSEYIYRVLNRLTFVGGLYLVAVCLLPTLLISETAVPFYFGGTSLLIVVGVALDTVSQIESHLVTRSYDGFLNKARVRSRRG